MSVSLPFAVIFLAGLANAFFQLDLGGLLLLYHSSLKKHITKKTRTLVSNYILGVSLIIILCLGSVSFVILGFFGGELSVGVLSIIVGLLLSLAIIFFTIYYRTGRSTELWLPKAVTRYVNDRAEKTSSRVEAFSLGMLTALAELPFSIILFFIASDSLLKLPNTYQILGILLYVFMAVLPLTICRFFIRRGSTIVDIQRWRVKNKPFLKFTCGMGFIALAIFLLTFKVLGELL